MDESSWRQQTSDRLRNLARSIESWAPNLLYGAVTGCAILPVGAAAQPCDALYGVLGGAGLSLVSNVIQQRKDRSDAGENRHGFLGRVNGSIQIGQDAAARVENATMGGELTGANGPQYHGPRYQGGSVRPVVS